MNALKKIKKPAEKSSVHFVFVEEPLEKVARELLKWEEAVWWPKKPVVAIARQGTVPIQVGTVFVYKMLFFPSWMAEVSQFIPSRLWVNTFKSKVLQGTETIRIEERANGTKVEYQISYQVHGLINKVLWALIGDKVYSNNMKKIMASFREHIVHQAKADQEKNFEGKS